MNSQRLPLQGIRVLDLGMFFAGPYAGKWLADAGAQVIKVESCSHPDNLRVLARGLYPSGDPGKHPWNRSGMINDRNRNKLGITLEMGSERGRELFKRLVAVSDVVLENFSARVMKRWGLDYESLRQVNPSIILCSVYSQGGSGPESSYVSFGGTLEQLAGIAYTTGYPDELPGIPNIQLPDPLGGTMAAGLVIAALRQRRMTGEGCHIDLSQRENAVAVIGDLLMDYSMNARIPERIGNRDPGMAPHGCYPCKGDDAWVAIAVQNDEEWSALCRAMGRGDLAHDERFLTVVDRHAHHDELDLEIAAWTRSRTKFEAMATLQEWGIAAGAVYNVRDLYEDKHLRERDFWEVVNDTEAGQHLYTGRPFRLSRTPLSTWMPAPLLGEHNEYVFKDLLGLSDKEIEELHRDGIIGSEPTEEAKRGRL